MGKRFFMVLAICITGVSEAKSFDYSKVFMAGTGSVGTNLVRYLTWTEDYCILIQNLIPGGKGKVLAEKAICSLDGKNFSRDYADVEVKSGEFKDGKLLFEIGVTPLQPVDEKIMSCEVVFHNDLADHLSCK